MGHDGRSVGGEQWLRDTVEVGHGDVGVGAGFGDGAQQLRLEEGHVAGDGDGEVVADQRERCLESGQGPRSWR